MHDKTTFDYGFDLISTYVEQNISHEMLKSMVLKAAQYAANVTGVSVYTARKWAATYYMSLVGVRLDDIDAEFMDDLLSFERGRCCRNSGSILHDEKFHLLAQEFVHKKYIQDRTTKHDIE